MHKTLFVLAAIYSLNAFATLGEPIERDRQSLSATSLVAKTQHTNFTKHEQISNSFHVNQFTNNASNVFAVTWQGRGIPDLRALLGSHLYDFQQALVKARQTHKGHAPLEIEENGLHIEMGGNPRQLIGRVWLTNAKPQGVSNEDLR